MPPKKKAANGYTFAEPLPKGTVIEDIAKKSWRLGPSIGKGGFGEIYSAQEGTAKGDKYPYVVKIEPHSNGPLFVEINFYIRHAKPADVENFKKENGLKTFGMPVYYGSGSHEYKGQKYRFLVMDKFASDLFKLYIDNNKVFPVDTVFKIALQLLDVLEYIHQRGYVHADIKAANVLLGATKDTLNKQVYLVDFGLATKFTVEDKFKPNPKKAHDGTIEFLSRDAHQGVQTRRGDLEILAYNLIQWLGCKLPWEGNLGDPKVVQKSKEENMSSVPKMIKACFGTNSCPKAITDFLTYLQKMAFNTEPDYKKIKNIFLAGVKEAGGSLAKPLQFSQAKTPSKRTRTPVISSTNKKIKSSKPQENEIDEDGAGETPKTKRGGRAKKGASVEKDDETPLTNSRSKKVAAAENQENEVDGDETPKPKRGRLAKKKVAVEPDDEMDVAYVDQIDSDCETTPVGKLKRSHPKESEIVKDVVKKPNNTQKRTLRPRKNAPRLEVTETLSDLSTSTSEIDYSDKEDAKVTRKKGLTKKRTPKNVKKKFEQAVSDSEITPVDDDDRNFVTKRPKKQALNRKISKSLDNLADPFEGCTQAMKEIMLKKMEKADRKKRPQKAEPVDDLTGYTDEMKELAAKKRTKAAPSMAKSKF